MTSMGVLSRKRDNTIPATRQSGQGQKMGGEYKHLNIYYLKK
jgi:hypothetical protein